MGYKASVKSSLALSAFDFPAGELALWVIIALVTSCTVRMCWSCVKTNALPLILNRITVANITVLPAVARHTQKPSDLAGSRRLFLTKMYRTAVQECLHSSYFLPGFVENKLWSMQDSLYATRPPFHCASAEAVQAAAAIESPLLRLASLFTADSKLTPSQRQPSTSRPPGKRLAPESAIATAHAAKKQRSKTSEALSQPQVGTGTALQTKAAELGLVQSCAGPRRLVPQQILPIDNSNTGATSSRQGLPRRVVPEKVTSSDQHTTSSDSKRADPSTCQVKQQAYEHAMPKSHSHLATASQHLDEDEEEDYLLSGDRSHGGSEAGSDEACELEEGSDEGSDGGSEEGQPSKVIAEFGAAGDAWWHDFIAAKEEMLNTVLLVGPCTSLHFWPNLKSTPLSPA